LKGNDISYKKRICPLKYGGWRIIIVAKYEGVGKQIQIVHQKKENKSKYNKGNPQLKLTKL